jgi:hypothetical protein
MPAKSCRVTFRDLEGVSHTVEVTAETLYEAVALGLAAIRRNDWVAGIAERPNVKVFVADIPVEHEVKIQEFTAWLERSSRSPRELTERKKFRAILGMLDSTQGV